MNLKLLKDTIDGTDIYILDQILKGNFKTGGKVLDAGCGNGRNLKWFYNSDFEIHGIDIDAAKIVYCKELFKLQEQNFRMVSTEKMPYKDNYFDAVICNAVLHFALNLNHFYTMFEQLLRVLKPEGMLFIRMASNFGIASQIEFIKDGIYKLPDNSSRFLLTTEIINDIQNNYNLEFIEDLKTTIVHQKRSMTTLILKKI